MKKFLIFIVAVLTIGVIGAVAFVMTFDVNRYRPAIIKQLEDATGKPVDLGHLSLGWRGGIALEIKDLNIYPSAQIKTRPSGHLDEASVLVNLGPLLRKQIQIVSVVLIKPALVVVRTADGDLEVAGISTMPKPQETSKPPSSASSAGAAPIFSADMIEIRQGQVYYTDRSPANPVSLKIDDLDVKIKDFSLTRPVTFELAAAVFSDKQNINITGQLELPKNGKPAVLDKFSLKTDLASLDLALVAKAMPKMDTSALPQKLAGKLALDLSGLDLDAVGFKKLNASLSLEAGELALRSLPQSLNNISLAAQIKGQTAQINQLTADFAKGKLKLTGTSNAIWSQPTTKLSLTADSLAVDALVPAKSPTSAHFTGQTSFQFTGSASGASWPQISQTLTGTGRLTLKDGVIANFNALNQIVKRLSVVPGIESLESSLPDNFKAKLNAQNTVLKPMDFPFSATNGTVILNNIVVGTDSLTLAAGGTARLDGELNLQGYASISPDFSSVAIKAAPILQALATTQGELAIPLSVTGKAPDIKILPDTKQIGSRLGMAATQQVVGNLLKKPGQGAGGLSQLLGGGTANAAAPAAADASAPSQPPSNTELLQNLLTKAIQGKKGQ